MDILTATGIIHIYVVFLLDKKELISEWTADVNVMILTFFLQVSYRCSVFCNLVLAVSRTIMILNDQHQETQTGLYSICLYAVPWIVLYGLNVHHFRENYTAKISDRGFLIGAGLAHKINRIRNAGNVNELLFTVSILPDLAAFFIPVTIVIITCIIQVRTLYRSSQFPTSSNQRHVTITVLLMSTLFVLCNSLHSGYAATLVMLILAGETDLAISLRYEGGFYFITVLSATVLPILNAALNPVIIITRSNGMRRKFLDSLQRMLHALRLRRE